MDKYFIYEPGYRGATFFDTEQEWKKEIEEFDFLGRYCDDGWSDEVNNVIAGIIPDGVEYNPDANEEEWEDEDEFYQRHSTHEASEDILHNLDENGFDETGQQWKGGFTHISTYRFEEIKP